MTKIAPVTMICLSIAAAVLYAADGDWRRAIYWVAKIACTATPRAISRPQ